MRVESIFSEEMSCIDGGGFEVLFDIRHGRTVVDVGEDDEVDTIEIVNPPVESQKKNTRVSIRPLSGRRNEFTVDFSTRHYAFSSCRSQTVRSLESFYQLHAILKVRLRRLLDSSLLFQTCHLYADVPSLPLKPLLWVTRPASQVRWGLEKVNLHLSQAKELAVYLSQVLQDRQLLSNKALHLFLQTRLSMEVLDLTQILVHRNHTQAIRDNLEGLRDDEILEQMKPGTSAETYDEQILNVIPHV